MSGAPAAGGAGRAPAPDLSVRLGPLLLKNPVVAASGTFGYGLEFRPYLDLGRLGGLVTKGLSLRPRRGNAPPRTCETAAGMLNAIGLANVGVEAFLEEKLPGLRRHDTAIIANIFGETLDEYVAVARRLNGAAGLHALELNLSCPNTEKGGIAFGVSPPVITEVVGAVRRASPDLPLIVKLTPNITDIAAAGRAAREGGADVLSLVNTFLGMWRGSTPGAAPTGSGRSAISSARCGSRRDLPDPAEGRGRHATLGARVPSSRSRQAPRGGCARGRRTRRLRPAPTPPARASRR